MKSQFVTGFYIRKAIFQGFFPILLAFLTFVDFIKQTSHENSGSGYQHLYFYTSLILFLYAQTKIILEFIYSTCSENIIFKKEVDLNQTTPQLLLSFNPAETPDNHFMITIKRIFKLRYSRMTLFQHIDKFSWFIGMDSPILIPYEIVAKLTSIKSDINEENDEILLRQTLVRLYSYHPQQYHSVCHQTHDIEQSLIPQTIITPLDRSIGNIQQQIFNKQNHSLNPNVV